MLKTINIAALAVGSAQVAYGIAFHNPLVAVAGGLMWALHLKFAQERQFT